MAKTMIFKSMFIVYVALTSLASMSESDPQTETSMITGFTTDLIHRDSLQSPSHDPSSSPSERIINALKRSLNRAQSFKARRSRNAPESDVTYSSGEYLMAYSVGSPPVPTLGIADTGSDIIWTQCQPCRQCFNQSLPLFEPKISKSYIRIPCNSTKCSLLPEAFCSSTTGKNCLYSVSYGDHSFTYGELATDTFTLASSGKKRVSIPKITFGCGFKNGGVFSGSESGIVGLGGGKGSLVRQLGHVARGKFSYCLVPLLDNSGSSKLHFGGKARVSGRGAVSTPLVKKIPDTFYYLTLEGISVGNQRVGFYDSVASSDDRREYEEGNIIIDSGTTLTMLPSGMYNKLEKAVKSSIKLKQIEDPERLLDLCYFSPEDVRIPTPNITVHFKGADLKWKQDNVFVRMSNVSVCLAARATDDVAIYGNLAQINFLVGYDLHKRTVSFKPHHCGKSS